MIVRETKIYTEIKEAYIYTMGGKLPNLSYAQKADCIIRILREHSNLLWGICKMFSPGYDADIFAEYTLDL